jgi:CTD small phosphatase-like protein 2
MFYQYFFFFYINLKTHQGGHFLTRPYLEKFLRELNGLYELVVFTAGMKDYANW